MLQQYLSCNGKLVPDKPGQVNVKALTTHTSWLHRSNIKCPLKCTTLYILRSMVIVGHVIRILVSFTSTELTYLLILRFT